MAKTNPVIGNKNLTKIERATALYHEVTSSKLPEGVAPRRAFMDRAGEIDMTAAGANTYFQNIKTKLEDDGVATADVARISRARSKRNNALETQIQKIQTKVSALNQDLSALAKKLA